MTKRTTRNIVNRDLATGEELVLRSMPYFHNPVSMAVSPDGRQLAIGMTSVKIDGEYQPTTVLVIPTSGGEPREILRLKDTVTIISGSLSWSPDGKYVLYGDRTKGYKGREIWRVPVDGGDPETVSDLGVPGIGHIRLHPDGKRVAFITGDEKSEIWVMEGFLSNSEPTK